MSKAERVAVVTGASQGIGAALVRAFRSRNYRVVANSRSIKATADPDVVAVQGDVRPEDG
jgi:NAD(P)-dependent dehydrogenase (short-subunit alcohol dehydrogenase family)